MAMMYRLDSFFSKATDARLHDMTSWISVANLPYHRAFLIVGGMAARFTEIDSAECRHWRKTFPSKLSLGLPSGELLIGRSQAEEVTLNRLYAIRYRCDSLLKILTLFLDRAVYVGYQRDYLHICIGCALDEAMMLKLKYG